MMLINLLYGSKLHFFKVTIDKIVASCQTLRIGALLFLYEIYSVGRELKSGKG